MRDFHLPGRSPVYATRAMAATSQPAATAAALELLMSGGNAADAAVAAAAVLGVVEPQSSGLGGDSFFLYAPRGKDVVAYNGSGRAPAAAETAWFLDQGIKAIEQRSPHAVAVPGAIDAWARLVADHGRKDLAAVLAPAIRLAEDGYIVHPRVARDWKANVEKLRACEASAERFLVGGEAPAAGTRMRNPALAATLKAVAKGGRDAFYRGAIAERLAESLGALGALHTADDFARFKGEYVQPISAGYRGRDVVECPPNAQGLVALMMLNILEGYPLAEMDPLGVERIRLELEAARLALEERNRFLADPAVAEIPVDRLISKEHAAKLRARIGKPGAGPQPDASLSNTTYVCVVDEDLNVVSLISSLFQMFGGGLSCAHTGTVFNNRAAYFTVDPGHPNTIAPGKRPLHTTVPGMTAEGGAVSMAFGVTGGDFQPVGHAHVLTNLFDFGMDVQEALDAPRVMYVKGTCEIETPIPEDTLRGLADLGYNVKRTDTPLGSGQIIRIDRKEGMLIGGSDHRRDGCALGY